MRVGRPYLSSHQRLVARIDVQIDGAELARRRGNGQALIALRLTDEAGRTYDDHGTIELQKVEESLRAANVIYTQSAFVVPGSYRVEAQLAFTATGERSVKTDRLHVAPLKNDVLPDAWRGLPSVEFLPAAEAPEAWYLSALTGRLHAAAAARSPVRLEVLVNLTPSERESGSVRVQGRNLGALLPSLKVLSQTEWRSVTLNVTLLDLALRRVAFRQEAVKNLDWPRLKEALARAEPGKIDVKSLEARHHQAEFFVAEVSRRLESVTGPCVIVILSSGITFEPGQDLRPIGSGRSPAGRVFFARFFLEPARILYPSPEARGRRRSVWAGRGPVIAGARFDQLAATLKPLGPQVFDIATPEQFRKALAGILGAVAEM
jgi:hypothetical protein